MYWPLAIAAGGHVEGLEKATMAQRSTDMIEVSLSPAELEIVIGCMRAVAGEWGLHSDEEALLADFLALQTNTTKE